MKHFFRIFVAVSVALGAVSSANATLSQTTTDTSLSATAVSVENLLSEQTAVQFTLKTPSATIDNEGFPQIAGLDQVIRDAGAPALPVYTTLVAVPPEASVTVTVETADSKSRDVTYIPPVGALTLAPISPIAEAWVNVPDKITNEPSAAIYQNDAFFPQARYELSEPMYYRDVRFVRLHLYPLRYNPVSQQLWQAHELHISLEFNGGQTAVNPDHEIVPLSELETAVINPEFLNQWRQFPDSVMNTPATVLPTDRDTFKIEITADGIYDITYETLQAAGMDVANIDPHTFAMLHRGEAVAYQFIGNENGQFEAGEAIRFYGWAFAGTRHEKLFIDTNIFWLWAGDTPALVGNKSNQANQPGFAATDTFRSSKTYEESHYYFTGWSTDWSESPNEPDNFYSDHITHTTETSQTFPIMLPNPAPTGANATYTVELSTRHRDRGGINFAYHLRSRMNEQATFAEEMWFGNRNFNLVETTIPAASLRDGENDIHLDLLTDTQGGNIAEYLLNRITVDYTRQLVAIDDTLIFGDETGGQKTFFVDGFAEGDAVNALVWDISNPYQPQQIAMQASHVVAEGGGFRYLVGSEHGANGRFLATTHNNIKNVAIENVSRYRATNLTPPNNQADWLVITYGEFAPAADRLAAHRANPQYGDYHTHRVTIQDIINQYGYGLHHPEAIRHFLTHALANWDTAPRYVLLVGDASTNPLQLPCLGTSTCTAGGWSQDDETFIVTDLIFIDRYQGQVVADHPLVLLSGNDDVADMAIGRISANTLTEANAAVDKIIWYEEQQLAEAAWQKNNLFIADNDDPTAGFFCNENEATRPHVPDVFQQTHLCFNEDEVEGIDPTNEQTDALRAEMGTYINGDGVGIVNYRGHGGRDYWAGPRILSTNEELLNFWKNFGKPPVVLSADCLDGHFGWPSVASLSETWLRMGDLRGSSAHWSSTGLGLSFEHTILHQAFYDHLHRDGRIGNSILFAKLHYITSNQHISEVYSFTLQGDPAMRIYSPTFTVALPIVRKG
ncbi:MAG: C25 family cysteine peptidase [Chloroflexota bacterium]